MVSRLLCHYVGIPVKVNAIPNYATSDSRFTSSDTDVVVASDE